MECCRIQPTRNQIRGPLAKRATVGAGTIYTCPMDHIIILSEAHLRHVLRVYASYYNEIRTHRSLEKDTPVQRPVQAW